MKEDFKFRLNRKGQKIYTYDCIVDCKGLKNAYDQGESTEELNQRIQEKSGETEDEVALSLSNGPSPPGIPDDGKVRVLWRLVSGAKLWPSSSFPYPQCVDFGHDSSAAISRDVVPLIEQSNPDIMWNHSIDSKDIAGSVEKPYWEETTDKLEGGINATLTVDPEYDPKAAKGLRSGIIRAGSIGIDGDYVPSHPKMLAQEFIKQQGKMIDGEMVRWLPVKITAVRHMALVPSGMGADPMAGPRVALNNIKEEAQITNKTGGSMGSELRELFSAVCKDLGVEVALSDGTPIPEMLENNLMGKLGEMKKAQLAYSSIYDRVLRACELSGSRKYSGKSIDEILDGLPTDLVNAENGVAFLEFQKKEALKAFDSAKVDPAREELGDNDKKIRLRISSSQDIGYIQEALEEYKSLALNRFGSMKSSADEEIPKVDIPVAEVSRDIVDSVSRMFGGDK
jgi:hypothetical protein